MVRGLVVLAALLMLLPTATAFPASQDSLSIAYAASGTPTMIVAGALFMDGPIAGGLAIAGASDTSLERVPSLRIIDRTAPLSLEKVERGVTLIVESGSMLWTFPKDQTAAIATSQAYAVAVALPQAPIPSDDGAKPAGFVLASERVTGTLNWTGGEAALLPLDAVITIQDAKGQPLEGWNARRVNRDASMDADPESADIGFVATGAFTARLSANIVAGATGGAGKLRLVIDEAAEDRFVPTKAAFSDAAGGLFGDEGPFSGGDNPLDLFEPVSGVLNGAILAVPNGGDGGNGNNGGNGGDQAPATVLLESKVGDKEFPLGPITIIRGSGLELSWSTSQMRIDGKPTVALGKEGFAVNEPMKVGLFPILSLILWLLAIGSIVFYFVKRPPKGTPTMSLRLTSIAIWALALILALFLWDRSFEQSFGTGVVSLLKSGGLAKENLPRLGIVAALEFAPWSIAGLLFALPVRIGLGVGLRYLGRGKSFKGLATAGGLVSLALLGPIYALWCFNLVWARVAGSLPGAGP